MAARILSCLLVLGGCSLSFCACAAQALGIVTIVDGEGQLWRDGTRYALSEGLRVEAGDLLELGEQARLLRIEFTDGSALGLGGRTSAQLAPELKSGPRVYLLRGWAKLSAAKGKPLSMVSAAAALGGISEQVVTAIDADTAYVFAESGDVSVRPSRYAAAAPLSLHKGDLMTQNGSARAEVQSRPSQAFVSAVPKAFLDSLPDRAALFANKTVQARRLGDVSYTDLHPWLHAEPALRRANLPLFQPLSRKPEFRQGLIAEIRQHPEWQNILFPPQAASSASAPSPATKVKP